MDKGELIHNWINYDQLDYDIFLCFTYDILSNEINDRYIITHFSGNEFPCVIPSYQFESFLKNYNSLSNFFTEDGEILTHDKMSLYWKSYLDGFIYGFSDFKNKLKEDISVYNNNSFIEEIVKHRLTNLYKYSLGGWKEIDKKKIIEKSNFYNVGIEAGSTYYAWSFIIKGNNIFKNIIQSLYKGHLPYLKHHHRENDYRPIYEFPCHVKEDLKAVSKSQNLYSKDFINFKDLIRDDYLQQDQYNRFINILQKKETTLSKPILNDDKTWNYSAVQILKLYVILKDNKILKNEVTLLYAKEHLSNTFGIKHSSILRKTVNDIGTSGEAKELHHKLNHYINKIFLNK